MGILSKQISFKGELEYVSCTISIFYKSVGNCSLSINIIRGALLSLDLSFKKSSVFSFLFLNGLEKKIMGFK